MFGSSYSFNDPLTTCFHNFFHEIFFVVLLGVSRWFYFCKIISDILYYFDLNQINWSRRKKNGEIWDSYWLLDVLSEIYIFVFFCVSSAMSIAESSKFPGYGEETSNGSGNSPVLSHSNSANSGFSRSAATGTPRPGSFSQQNNSQLHLWIPEKHL